MKHLTFTILLTMTASMTFADHAQNQCATIVGTSIKHSLTKDQVAIDKKPKEPKSIIKLVEQFVSGKPVVLVKYVF